VDGSISIEGKTITRRERWTYEFLENGKLHVTDKREGESYDGEYEQVGTSVTMITGDRIRMGSYDGEDLEFIRGGSPEYPGFYKEEIKRITLLGDGEELNWKRTKLGLEVEMPEERPCDHAYVIKIERHHHPKLD